MDRAGDDLQELWPSNQTSRSITPAILQPWMPPSSSTDYHWPAHSAGPTSWPRGYYGFVDPFTRPVQASIEGTSPQHHLLGFSGRSHDPRTSPGDQITPSKATSNADCGRSRKQSNREDTPRLERRNTKRRKTGPDRFANYLFGEMPLPPDTTTTEVFKKYPNHVTDEDIEELWRLGLSARQISDLMPADTHFNSEGVHVQQHHSLIQKKFKIFKERYDSHERAMNYRADQSESQGLLRPSNSQETSMQERQNVNSGAAQNAASSHAGRVADLPEMKFRYYPLNPTNDQAFEARMSIELADLEPLAGHRAHEDHEIHFLNLLLRREFQRHVDLLRGQFAQAQTLNFQQVSLYNEISGALSRKWPIPPIATTTPITPPSATPPEALRVLQHVIDQIYLHHPTIASPPAKRAILNFQHRDLRTWKVLGRTLYYLVSITRRLEMVGPKVDAASTQTALAENLWSAQRHFGADRAGLGSQTISTSHQEIRPLNRMVPVRASRPTRFSDVSATTSHRRFPSAAFGEATGTVRVNSPQAPTHFATSSLPTASRIPSTSPGNRVGHEGGRGLLAQNALLLTRGPQAPAPQIDSLQPGMSAAAHNLLSEADNYISFQRDGEDGDDFMDEIIDWDEWDATSIARAESSKTAN